MTKTQLVNLIFEQDRSLLANYKQHSILNFILEDLIALEHTLSQKMFELTIISAYRSFNQQKNIWNKKAEGELDLLDKFSNKINIKELTNEELFYCILNWSAFPGLSRHHFGTELDIADATYLQKNPSYKVQLIDSEYHTGVFQPFISCVTQNIKKFYFPYQKDIGGIKPEPWHLSHNFSKNIMDIYTYQIFKDLINSELFDDLLLIDIARKKSEELYSTFFLPVINI